MQKLNQSGIAHTLTLLSFILLIAISGVFLLVRSTNTRSNGVLGSTTSTTADVSTSPKSKGYAIVTRKYKDFDINYALQKGLNTGMYPTRNSGEPEPCKVIKTEVLNNGHTSKTTWECVPGVWYAFPTDADENSPIAKAYKAGNPRSKYTVKVKVKSGKTVKAKTIVLRKSDL